VLWSVILVLVVSSPVSYHFTTTSLPFRTFWCGWWRFLPVWDGLYCTKYVESAVCLALGKSYKAIPIKWFKCNCVICVDSVVVTSPGACYFIPVGPIVTTGLSKYSVCCKNNKTNPFRPVGTNRIKEQALKYVKENAVGKGGPFSYCLNSDL